MQQFSKCILKSKDFIRSILRVVTIHRPCNFFSLATISLFLWSLHKFILMYILVPPRYESRMAVVLQMHIKTLWKSVSIFDCAQNEAWECKNWNEERKWIVGGGVRKKRLQYSHGYITSILVYIKYIVTLYNYRINLLRITGIVWKY